MSPIPIINLAVIDAARNIVSSFIKLVRARAIVDIITKMNP